MSTASKVALDKQRNPTKYCPEPRCLWRTGTGQRCSRHWQKEETNGITFRTVDYPGDGGDSGLQRRASNR
jgi:hypothetical protein